MAIQKSEAIVLRRQDLRQTSLIVTFYTKDFGKIKGVLKGVRGARAQHIGGAFESFSHDQVVFYERKRSDFSTVSQCELLDFFGPIRSSLERLAYAAYVIELLDNVTTLADPHEEIFDLLLNSLSLLAGDDSPRRITRIFEIKLLSLLGLMPTLEKCAHCSQPVEASTYFSMRNGGLVCQKCSAHDQALHKILPGTVKFIEHIRNLPLEKVARIKVSADVGKDVERTLRKFIDYHVDYRLKTLKFLREIGE